MSTVSLVTVTFNSASELPGLIESIKAAAGLLHEVVAVDNASGDDSAGRFGLGFKGAKVIRNTENTGFAAAANQGIEATTSDYVLLVNPDVAFRPEFITRLAEALDADPGAGSAAPLLMRPDGVTVDSAGLSMRFDRKAVDRGRDGWLTSILLEPKKIFGACGAAAMYRRSALSDARVSGEIFDVSFFAYKEDVDLAWRMGLLGWDCLYVPGAAGTHARGWKTTDRKRMPKWLRLRSFLNRYLCIFKNDDLSSVMLHLPWIAVYELKLLGYALVFEPFLLGACSDIMRLWSDAKRKRSEVMRRRRRTPREMRKLFG